MKKIKADEGGRRSWMDHSLDSLDSSNLAQSDPESRQKSGQQPDAFFFSPNSQTALLFSFSTYGAAWDFFLPPYAVAGIRTHVSRVARIPGAF